MPVPFTWPRYIAFVSAAMMTTLAGAQVVHTFYKPLDDLETLVQKELERRKKEVEKKQEVNHL